MTLLSSIASCNREYLARDIRTVSGDDVNIVKTKAFQGLFGCLVMLRERELWGIPSVTNVLFP